MGKSRQRPAHTQIIDKKELRTPARRVVESSITAVLWVAWMYWILPVITIALWALGIKMFYRTLFYGEQFRQLHQVLRNGGIALLVIFSINLLWISYNYFFIYRRLGKRRKESRQCGESEFAAFYHIDENSLTQAKQHNRFEITLADGKITIDSATTIQ